MGTVQLFRLSRLLSIVLASLLLWSSAGLASAQTTSKFRRVDDYFRLAGTVPNAGPEVDLRLQADYRVITGVGLRMNPGDATTLVVMARRLNAVTGELEGPVLTMSQGNSGLEAQVGAAEAQGSENVLLSGLGIRANPGDVTTLVLWTKDIGSDGTLGNLQERRSETVPGAGPEVQILVPDPYVIVSVGVRANPGDVTTLKGYFGHLVVR